jgi:hypothetical protein
MRSQCMKLMVLVLFALPTLAFAQLEVGSDLTYASGNNGLTGFSGTAGWQYGKRVTLVGEGDFLWDTSRVGVFDLSPNTGVVSVKSNSQNYLFGARVKIIGWKPLKSLEKRKILPFGEILFGYSRLSQTISETSTGSSMQAADRAYSWALGGGVDYTLTNHWLARGKVDLLRTHFVDAGQSRLRLNVGLAYIF